MKKNVIWWTGIVNPDHDDKYGGYEYFEYSKNTWKYWCEQNDCLFVEFNQPVETDLFKFRVNWQKALFVFDELEKRNIEYDQIALVDSSCMIKWDTPNFFNLTERKFVAWRDLDNLNWVYQSIIGYKDFFGDFKLDTTKYINSGFIIFNEIHKKFFTSFKQLYYDNIDEFCKLQDKVVKKGTEQTPLNYWLQINDIDIKTDLPLSYKLTHLHRKDMFSYNWQLNEDKTPFFIKYGYNWIFNGLPKDQRSNIMKQVWDTIKHHYDMSHVLNKINNKDKDKDTTSNKFKEDILKYFSNFKDKTILELGSNRGNTSRVYAECFEKVIGVEHKSDNILKAKELCSDVDNVEFILSDAYSETFELPTADVVHIDAGHNHDQVCYDIDRCITYMNKPILIFDDCCKKIFPDGTIGNTIRTAIDQKISEGKIEILKYIGANNGYVANNGKMLTGVEGIICKVI